MRDAFLGNSALETLSLGELPINDILPLRRVAIGAGGGIDLGPTSEFGMAAGDAIPKADEPFPKCLRPLVCFAIAPLPVGLIERGTFGTLPGGHRLALGFQRLRRRGELGDEIAEKARHLVADQVRDTLLRFRHRWQRIGVGQARSNIFGPNAGPARNGVDLAIGINGNDAPTIAAG
jgi:hypothetical protein